MINALTIDVEDYHNSTARARRNVIYEPTRAVVTYTTELLELFATHDVRGTFFILADVAETYPQLIKDIAAAGHELGVHGYYHEQVFKLIPEKFRDRITAAKSRIEDTAGVPVHGHRAPAFSIMPKTSWALEVLAEAGFRYDASIAPIRGRRYGWPGFPTDIHTINLDSGRSIIEVPVSTVSLLGLRVPACGGGYLRHLPGFFTEWAFRRIQRRRPVIVYAHPWELELNPPPIDTSGMDPASARLLRRLNARSLRNRHTVKAKLTRLLERFEFAPLAKIIEHVLQKPLVPETPGPAPTDPAG